MAQQISVNSATGNIQIQISRGAIGPSTTANVANTALNLNAASTANVVIGGGVANYVLSTDGAGNTSWVAQTGGGATNPAGANTQVQFNDQGSFGAESTFTYDKTTDVLTVDHFSGEAGNLSNIQGANVSGAVANASHATISDSANSVAVANVAGIGNIATVNLDGNVSNVLAGDGTFIAAGGGGGTYGDSNVVTLLNAFGSNTITTTGLITGDGGGLSNIAGANISGAVANATHATVADSANAVAGANVTGEVPFAAVANSVTLANVSGAGNIASLNIDGNAANYLDGTGTFAPVTAASATTAEQVIRLCKATQTIAKGQAVTITGGTGSNPDVSLSDASSTILMPSIGIALENIATNATGNIALYGEVAGIDTTAFAVGESVYISATIPGALTNVAPVGETNLIQKVGKVVRDNANGIVMVQGAGRTNATPNLNEGNIFVGNATNESSTANLNGLVNTHLAAFGSNTITTTGSVDTGNLAVNGTNGNITFTPDTTTVDGNTFSKVTQSNVAGSGSEAIIATDYTDFNFVDNILYAQSTSGNIAEGPGISLNLNGAIGNANTDAKVRSTISLNAYGPNSNLASTSTSTRSSLEMGGQTGGFIMVTGSDLGTDFGRASWQQFQYQPGAMSFWRRNGNGEARQGVVANDKTTIEFIMASNNGSGSTTWASNPAAISAKVDSSFSGADNAVVPTGLEFTVVDDVDTLLSHNFYGNGDVTFNATGVITGDGGGLSNIASANVTGLGNIATLNLDGNAANYLDGTGTWTPVSAGASANFANFAGNVTVATQSNITLTGNLVSFTTNNTTANTPTHQIDPALITMPVNYTDTKAQEVINLWGDDNTGNYYGGAGTTTYLMNDVNTGFEGYAPIVTDYAASNGAGGYYRAVRSEIGMDFAGGQVGTDAYAPGRVVYTFAGENSDMSSTSSTLGEITLTQGGIQVQPRTTTATGTGVINVFYYGSNIANPIEGNGLDFTRRRGNNASRVDIAAGDYLGNVRWAGRKATGFNPNKAVIGGRVSPSWDGTGEEIPTELFMNTQDNNSVTSTWEYGSDGDSFFPGNLTLNNAGIFTGDGGGLSNVSATATPGGFIDSVQFNNSGVLGGDATLTYNSSGKQLTLNGTAGSNAAMPTFNVNNGGFNITQEEIGGGQASFTFKNFYAGTQIAPSTYFRARGTLAAQTQVAAGDQILSDGYYVNSGVGHLYTSAGGRTVTVNSNDGLGNVAVSYQISTANPTNPNSQDKIDLNSKFVTLAGNIQMTDTTARFTAGRIAQIVNTFATLPASPVQGERAMISDGPSYNTFGTVVSAGSGTNTMPLFWDGSDWRMG